MSSEIDILGIKTNHMNISCAHHLERPFYSMLCLPPQIFTKLISIKMFTLFSTQEQSNTDLSRNHILLVVTGGITVNDISHILATT